MLAFIIAGIIVVLTIVSAFLTAFGNAFNSGSTRGGSPWPTLIGGLILAAVVASSHWWNISW